MFLPEQLLHPRARRRAALLHQKRHSLPVPKTPGQRRQRIQRRRLAAQAPVQGVAMRPVRIIQAQAPRPARTGPCRRRCPGGRDCPPPWSARPSLDLTTSGSAPRRRRHGRGKILRHAVRVILRHLGERINVLHRPPAARRAQARQQERRRHDLDKMPPRHRIKHFARAGRKFPFHPLPELRRLRQFVQTAPIGRPGRFGCG